MSLRTTPAGAQKLAQPASKNGGKSLGFTIDDPLLGTPRVGSPIENGILILVVGSDTPALKLAGAIVGQGARSAVSSNKAANH